MQPGSDGDRGALSVDGPRLLRLLNELARFGADEDGGVTRPGFSEADNAARAYLAAHARAAGLVADIDEAGNLIVRRPGGPPQRPVLLLGSHLDTVLHGGRLDGAYGVVAAIEVVRALVAAESLRYEPVAVGFSNEEGALFACPFFGSKALVGRVEPIGDMRDLDGRPLDDALRAAGGDLAAVARAAWPAGAVAGYLELHIEQGPVLEVTGIPIGVVEAITGRTVLDIEVVGEQNHAGTTPMDMRHDALVTAAKLVLAIEHVSTVRGLCSVSTVGQLDVRPGSTNVVPGSVRLTADLRDGVATRLAAAEAAVRADADRLAAQASLVVEVGVGLRTRPTDTDPALREMIAGAAKDLGLATLTMFSGAGHDAQIVAEAAPVGMVFVPSRAGISHAPAESTDERHLIDGANVLLGAALRAVRPD
jgi:N-carbamoyl-L-amino-acid hydrolase